MSQITISILLFTALSTPAWCGTYMENFNDGDFKGWQPVGRIQDCWKVVDGELCGDTNQLGYPELVLNLGRRNWGNYTVECDVMFIELYNPHLDGSQVIRLGTRKLAGIEGDIEKVTLDGVTLELGLKAVVIDNRFKGKITVKDEPFETKANKWHHLKLVMDYDTAEGYVDGGLVCELRVNMSNYGGVSVSFSSAHIHFDNVLLIGKGIPNRHALIATTWAKLKKE